MSMKLLPIRLRTDIEEVKERVEVSEGVHDGCPSKTPSVDGVQVPGRFGSSGRFVSDHVRFIKNDSVPQHLE